MKGETRSKEWSKFVEGGYIGDFIGDYYKGYKWDTRSLDFGSRNEFSASGGYRRERSLRNLKANT